MGLSFLVDRIHINSNTITKYPNQKYLGVVLNSKLGFNIHVEQKKRNAIK